ncbi:hypothetical protein ACU686_40210 [Yinghuangia aomiensis]
MLSHTNLLTSAYGGLGRHRGPARAGTTRWRHAAPLFHIAGVGTLA